MGLRIFNSFDRLFFLMSLLPMPLFRMPLHPVPRPLQIVKCLLVRIIPARQFPLIEIIRRIGIAELRVLFHILFCLLVRVFRLVVRARFGVFGVFVLAGSHDNCFLQFAQKAGRIPNGTSFAVFKHNLSRMALKECPRIRSVNCL